MFAKDLSNSIFSPPRHQACYIAVSLELKVKRLYSF
jgi:hypothetical protein